MIRRLAPGDADLARRLNAMMGAAFDDADAYARQAPDAAWLEGALALPHVVALAAVEDGTVVGGLVGYLLPKLERAASEFYLYDLAVAEAHRRRGIATALIAEARRIAAGEGAWVMFVQADHGDDPAVALYTKLGTREDVMHFDLPVTADA
jgi:aminoglycoside 3-N-acetyltransferase I